MLSKKEFETSGVVHLDEIGVVGKTKLVGLGKIETILEKHKKDKDSLPTILADIQAEYGWIPENALEFVAKSLNIPINKLYDTLKNKETEERLQTGKYGILEYYPQCPDCESYLTNIPFKDTETVVMTSFECNKCGKNHWFYIDLEKIFRRKNKWCPQCSIFTRNYTANNECPVCGSEVYRTKSRINKDRATEYYPKCPDCGKVLTDTPFTDIDTVCIVEDYCPDCDKNHWQFIDLQRMFKSEVVKQ